MIDFHCHIIPGFDDGSKDVTESLEMLKMMKKQGVDIVCATSHYYPTKESPAHFLKRREAAFDKLRKELTDDLPIIKLGAEVQYFEGMSNADNLADFKIESTNLLLIEMPFQKWSSRMIEEIVEINSRKNYQVVLAHIERYFKFNSLDVFSYLSGCGIMLQSNASYFESFFDKNKALKLVGSGLINMIGSDSHNTTDRPVNIEAGFKAIEKKFGKKMIRKMDEFSHSLFFDYFSITEEDIWKSFSRC